MSRIRGRDTGPELALRRALWAAGCRFRANWREPTVKVRIDIAALRRRIAIFVDGCFWHGCPLHAVTPTTNTAFWTQKIQINKARDDRQTKALLEQGWKVIRLWEHEIDDTDAVMACLLPMWQQTTQRTVPNNAKEAERQQDAR